VAWARGYSTPYEFAARSSADYDGHRKALGDTFGIKNADPNAGWSWVAWQDLT
jgi:hypothetical protein